ncbi:MAG: tRNA glutamyl-Q(34) synthetase GluQRS [Propioniciclava sp.]
MNGRFAPSPTSDLHVGNLRTALIAWLMARHAGLGYLLRMEDLDATRVAAAEGIAQGQLADLAEFGLDHDGPVATQSSRQDLYAAALARLPVYECFCTRREIAEAVSAPHGAPRHYPGTCRQLSSIERSRRRATRPPALRVNAQGAEVTIADRWAGVVTGVVDDFVVRRNDGAYAYNLAVVVDDLDQGVTQVVRGDDLLPSSPQQAWLARTLGGREPAYAHVGLVVNEHGQRLAKRDGAVTMADLVSRGITVDQLRARLGASLGLCAPEEPVTAHTLLDRFDPARLAYHTWRWPG